MKEMQYESLVNECLIRTHSTTDPDQSLNLMLSFLGTELKCDRTDIYQFKEPDWLHHTYSWNKTATASINMPMKIKFVSYLREWYDSFYHNDPIILSNMKTFSEAVPDLYDYFGAPCVSTIILVPLMRENKVAGFLRLDNPGIEIKEAAHVCKILSYFIVSILERRELLVHLKQLSYHDQLTNAMNRYALHEYIESEKFKQAVGMIYCDIIGLKNVNDLLGHNNGDQLIIHTYQVLTNVFPPEQVYRIGGDEFLIICDCLEKQQFEVQIKNLEHEIVSQNCSLSIGSVWAEAGEKDFNDLLKIADSRMYEAKNNFYSQSDPVTGHLRKTQRHSSWVESYEPSLEGKNPFQTFIKNYHFDVESFFRSIVMEGTTLYLYCGDMQKNIYFISDNLKEDFNFSSNLVYDFVTLLEQRIFEGDRQAHKEDTQAMLDEKKTLHNIRYRIYNKKGEIVWMHCRGILKWNEDMTEPLFFSGSMTSMSNESEADPTTGMLNLSYGLDWIENLCKTKTELLILCFLLHSFSEINKMFGRDVGDSILFEIGNQIKAELGKDFVSIRMDGLRFMCVSKTVLDPVESVQKIHQTVRNIYHRYGAHIMYPCAVGVLRSPRDGTTAHELVENAMDVLRVAKTKPEIRFVEFSPEFSKKSEDRTDISMALNASINHMFEGFWITIQPQIIAKSGQIFGGEVLLRWKNQGQTISPSKFIPVLEQSGLIVPVGKWVIIQAMRVCRRILKIMPNFRLSFNISRLQIMDRSLSHFIKKALTSYGIPGENIVIELTETHFDTMPDHLKYFINECQKIGITFALDDFGNAYSSLQLLLQYPAGLIKLDRTLMQEITHSKDKMNFMMSVIYACHKFGKKVCVEGVETKEELEIIQQTDCDFIQGFYFSKPLEPEALYKMLKSLADGSENTHMNDKV